MEKPSEDAYTFGEFVEYMRSIGVEDDDFFCLKEDIVSIDYVVEGKTHEA